MHLHRSFENPPDHVFIVRGTLRELQELAQEFTPSRTPSLIDCEPLLVDLNGPIYDLKFTFSSPRDAMLFKLSVE